MNRITSLLSDMTLEEKLAQLGSIEIKEIVDENGNFDPAKAAQKIPHGIGQITGVAYTQNILPAQAKKIAADIREWILNSTRTKILPIFHEECLSGLSGKGAAIFPHPIGLGSMWAPNLVNQMTQSTRELMVSMGVNQGLSPVLDIATDPRWGRNEETYGEDPYLIAENAVAFITGLQGNCDKNGIIATAKHFAGHGQTEGGRNCSPVHMGERELRDSVLFPFEAAVRLAKVKGIMNAYHDIDGIPCAANRELLTGTLRDEWGFDGIVVSDYFSIERLISHHAVAADKSGAGVAALCAGVDIELPYTDCYGEPLLAAVNSGRLSEKIVDEAVLRHLRVKEQFGVLDLPAAGADPAVIAAKPESTALAREMAQKSIVLLKNTDDILPLRKEKLRRLAVIGPNAASKRNLLGCYSHAAINPQHPEGHNEDTVEAYSGREIIDLLSAVRRAVGDGVTLEYAAGCDFVTQDDAAIAQAVDIAKAADIAIVAVGDRSGFAADSTTGEGIDRVDTRLIGAQETLIRAVAATGTPVVLVLINGRPFDLAGITDCCTAILEAWLPGEQGGLAIADILFGACNPSGKLSVSLRKHSGQHPLPYNIAHVNYHKKYIDSDLEPLFPFGHGLSYTTFAYEELAVTPESLTGRGEVRISLTLRNTGSAYGEEVVQLYIRDEVASVARPDIQLKGFARVNLQPGEACRVEFTLHSDQLAFHNHAMKLLVEPGTFKVMVGASAKDIRQIGQFEISGDGYEVPAEERVYFSTAHIAK